MRRSRVRATYPVQISPAPTGPGNSDQRNILPHPYSDFVYAIVIEEYGMIGGGVVLILYLILLHLVQPLLHLFPIAVLMM